jgi:uncharacterized protein
MRRKTGDSSTADNAAGHTADNAGGSAGHSAVASSRARAMRVAFAPPEAPWVGVDAALLKMRRTIALVAAAIVLLVVIVIGVISHVWVVAGIGVAVVGLGLACALPALRRNFRSWGYCERDEDLLVTRGVLFRRLVVVPYGRMQLVDVTAGPFERVFGIATVRLHTAAAGTDAHIRGLTPDEAARLRDRLAALGEARSAGL